MENIFKRYCLEPFISRIPSSLPCIDESIGSSWGKIPYNINIYDLFKCIDKEKSDKTYTYSFIIDSYDKIMKYSDNAEYFIYDKVKGLWKTYENVCGEAMLSDNFIGFKTIVPKESEKHMDIVGIVDEKSMIEEQKVLIPFRNDLFSLCDNAKDIYDGERIVVENIERIIGKRRVPKNIEGKLVPIYVFYSDISRYIEFMEKLKDNQRNNCCILYEYSDFGGDYFLEFLKSELIKKPEDIIPCKKCIPYINVPVLLTYKYNDLGLMTAYEDDDTLAPYVTKVFAESSSEPQSPTSSDPKLPGTSLNADGVEIQWETSVTHEGKWWYCEGKVDSNTGKIVVDSENKLSWGRSFPYDYENSIEVSKLMSLKKRKIYYDENDNVLPGPINYNVGDWLKYPFVALHHYYVDAYDMMYDVSAGFAENYIVNVTQEGDFFTGSQIYSILDKTSVIDTPKNEEYPIEISTEKFSYEINEIFYDETRENALELAKIEVERQIKWLKFPLTNILSEANNKNSEIMSIRQNYEIFYTIKYGDKEEKLVESGELSMHLESSVTFTYVIGGKYRMEKDGLVLDETPESPSIGIWHQETYPVNIKKKIGNYFYNEIDFDAKRTDFSFKGIDYERKNIIFSDKVWLNDENMKLNNTDYFVFRDDRYNGISKQIKKDIDVEIDRGKYTMFEKLMKLKENKTFSDLENYGNNYFNL